MPSASRTRHLVVLLLTVAVLPVAGLLIWPHPGFDKYPEAAAALTAGRLGARVFDFSPLYLLLCTALGGPALRVLQTLMAGLAAAALADLARRSTGRLAVGWVTGLAGALALPVVLYASVLEPDSLFGSLAVLGLWALVVGRDRGPDWAVGAAGLVGLAAGLRPTGELLVLAVLVVVGLRPRTLRRRLTTVAAVGIIGAGVGLAPGWIAAGYAGASMAQVPMSAGEVLVEGNRPESIGLGGSFVLLGKSLEWQQASRDRPDYFHEILRRLARRSVSAGDRATLRPGWYWTRRVLAYARLAPLDFAAGLVRKLGFALGPLSAHDIGSVKARARAAPVYLAPVWLLMPLGLLGLALGAGRRHLDLETTLFVLAALVPLVTFYVVGRYRVLLVLLACLGLGLGVAAILELRAWDRRALVGLVAGVILAVVPGTSPWIGYTQVVRSRAAMAMTAWRGFETARRQRDAATALRDAVRVEVLLPALAWSHPLTGVHRAAPAFRRAVADLAQKAARGDLGRFLAGRALRRAGDHRSAAEALEALGRSTHWHFMFFDRLWDPWLEAARARVEAGDPAAAAADLGRSPVPESVEVLALRAVVDGSRAAQARRRLFAIHDRCSALLALGRAQLLAGDATAAAATLTELHRRLPGSALVDFDLSLAVRATGDVAQADSLAAQAHAAMPGHVFDDPR